MDLKKMRHYNKGKHVGKQSDTARQLAETSNPQDVPSVEEGGDLKLPTIPSTYFECQKGLGEWIDHVETFSLTSKVRFQQWAKGTQISLAQAELQQQSYNNVQTRIQEEAKHKSKSRRVIQKGSVITIKAVRYRQLEKAEKEKAAAIKKTRRSIQIAVNKAKASPNHCGINAHEAGEERKKQGKTTDVRGEIVPAELLVVIHDTERDPSPEDLESLQVLPDLLQALLLLEPLS
ncbi:hypothetical protein L873DRAFT_1920878 [Choiromyces venosus 120613-1]|uniref:Uncharacterized protein n=1 Tax=Choiromyces venosus 120613-1 TaxID=1336337 RepID=A0A3N4JFY6_9PEZI|nr:hypothetical protein L873DRAFT_1920878 [Choiromyces venosus 120613-1]